MNKFLRGFAAAVLVTTSLTAVAKADTLVATIYGEYDTNGIGDLPSDVTAGLAQFNNGHIYDTPTLFFVNPTAHAIDSASMTLSVSAAVNNGQLTYNNGKTQVVSLGSLAPHSVTEIGWGTGGPLFAYDYDDEYSSNYGAGLAGNSGSFAADCTLNTTGGHPEWTNFCAPVGNFKVAFSGVLRDISAGDGLDGVNVAAVFSEINVGGTYVGWQGLDPNGWSENATYDVHAGTVSGVLANIYVGNVDTVQGSPDTVLPAPGALALLGLGLVGLARLRRRSI